MQACHGATPRTEIRAHSGLGGTNELAVRLPVHPWAVYSVVFEMGFRRGQTVYATLWIAPALSYIYHTRLESQ